MPSLVGDQLAGVMRVSAIYGSKLVVDVPDKIWRKQLAQMKPKLLERINELWGVKRITEIQFNV
jgi:predicted nucleic acid-binding Zn ribbon protein